MSKERTVHLPRLIFMSDWVLAGYEPAKILT
jgi:hypothetical protein